MTPKNILLIHQSFPGQFGELAKNLAAEGHKVIAFGMTPQEQIPGVTIVSYKPEREQLGREQAPLLSEVDAKLIRGEGLYKALKALKAQGFEPDVIYAHPGWGESLFIKKVWPKARYVVYAEWFYNNEGQEVNFDPALPPLTEENDLRLVFKNLPFMQALSDCDAAIAPTKWQRSRFPEWAQQKINVVHEGLNLKELASVKPAALRMPSQKLDLRKGMPIITYSARYLEPVRGFHYFMSALPTVLANNPQAHVIIMGQDAGVNDVGYGQNNPSGITWRKSIQNALGDKLDWKRVHFLGMLPRKQYLSMLKLSACHVYLTTPFILSWSFLEAAALGLPIIASDTAPVREFDDLANLDFVNFTDVRGLAVKILQRLAQPAQSAATMNMEILSQIDQDATIPLIKDILFGEEQTQAPQAEEDDEDFEEVLILDDSAIF